MKNLTLTSMRDNDFYRACCRELSRAAEAGIPYANARDLVKATLRRPAPHFYISYRYAMRRQQKAGLMTKRQMWADFEATVAAIRSRHHLISRRDAVIKALIDMPAPRFYFSVKNGERIFSRIRRANSENLANLANLNP